MLDKAPETDPDEQQEEQTRGGSEAMQGRQGTWTYPVLCAGSRKTALGKLGVHSGTKHSLESKIANT